MEEDFASSLEEKDQEGGNAGHGDAKFEVSLRDEPDGKSRGKGMQWPIIQNITCWLRSTNRLMLTEVNPSGSTITSSISNWRKDIC